MNELDIRILELREEGYNYSGIQKKLGNPSKKYIRSVLLKHAPELILKDCNYKKL